MKYSQYVEFERVLNENNLTVDDVRENPNVLNEIGLGLVGAIFAGGLGILFRKTLLSWGIKSMYLRRLNGFASNFERTILKQVSTMAKKSAQYRQNLLKKEQSLRGDDSEEAGEERKALAVHKQNYDRRLTKEVNGFIDKIAELKTKEVSQKIEELPAVSEGHKLALKGYWEMKIVDTKLAAFRQLSDDGIITNKDVLDGIKQEAEDMKAETAAKLKNTKAVIDKEKKEAEGEEGKEKSMKETVAANIEELGAEKGKLKEEDLLRRVRMTIRDIKKVEDDDDQSELYDLLKTKVGMDVIKASKNVDISEPEDVEDKVEQSVLSKDDELD